MFREDLAEKYPALFSPGQQGQLQVSFELLEIAPPEELISNVNLIPTAGDQWLVIRDKNDHWDIPGGTLEPGETYLQTIQREMREEAGAQLHTFQLFGAFHYHSSAEEPYRPHLPHPEFYRVVGVGKVEVIGVPNDPDAHVIGIELITVAQAVERFRKQGRADLAALYLLAAEFIKN